MTESDEPFRIELTIAAPVDQVWPALRDPALIRRWHGWEIDTDGGLDAEIDFIYRQHANGDEASNTLSFGTGDTITLHDAGDGRTRLRMVRAPRGANPEWDDHYDEISEGWVTFTQQLRFALERHPGQDRRTLFFSGTPGPAGEPPEALGLDQIADVPPGGRYHTDLAGEPAAGQVWFRSPHQTGLSVDGWGDGLMIVATAPPAPQRPHPQAMAILTSYGLDATEHDALAERWTRWWEQTFDQ